MKKTALIVALGALSVGTAANAALVSAQVFGLYNADGSVPTSSKTMAIIDVDGDGLAGFDLANWDGSSFLPDADDAIITDGTIGQWNEATGDGDGFEAGVPGAFAGATLDTTTKVGAYSFISADAAGNNDTTIGEGDEVFLFWFPELAIGAAAPGTEQAFGVISLGVLPGPSGSLTVADLAQGNDYRASLTTIVPEPSSLALLALGGMAMLRRRRG